MNNPIAFKVPIDFCKIIYEDEISAEEIINNDQYRLCRESVDQFVLNQQGKLVGVISSVDLLKMHDEDIKDHINRNPITLLENDRFNKQLAESIFSTSNIWTIPVVDKKGNLLYCYERASYNVSDFVKREYEDLFVLRRALSEELDILRLKYSDCEIKILSDFKYYDIPIEEKNLISLDDIKYLDSTKTVVLLVFKYDFNAMKAIDQLVEKGIRFSACNHTGKNIIADVSKYYEMDEFAHKTLLQEVYCNANYFDLNDFQNIFQAIKMTRNLKGAYVEIGTYRGDSARAALLYMKETEINRDAYFFDTFQGFTYQAAGTSSDCLWANSHTETSIDFVDSRLSEFDNYHLIKSNIITDEIPTELNEIVVCNIDVDMYEAVAASLNKVMNRIVMGGVIIAEDYGHSPHLYGAQYAINEFYKEHEDIFYGIYMQSGQFFLIRK